MLENQEKWINFSYKETKRLFGYYLILLLISICWLVGSLVYNYEISEKNFSNIVGILMFSFPSGLLGGCVYYIRKLYKSCIQELVVDLGENKNYRKLGAKIYFYCRPIISSVLATLVNFGIVAGFYVINNQPDINSDRFFLFILLIAFYIGFCNGKVIIRIDKQGEELIESLFKGIGRQ